MLLYPHILKVVNFINVLCATFAQSQNVTREKLRKALFLQKLSHKMFMKLTPGCPTCRSMDICFGINHKIKYLDYHIPEKEKKIFIISTNLTCLFEINLASSNYLGSISASLNYILE